MRSRFKPMDNSADATSRPTITSSEFSSSQPLNPKSRIVPLNTQSTSFTVQSQFDDSNHSISLEPLSQALSSARSMYTYYQPDINKSSFTSTSTTSSQINSATAGITIPLHSNSAIPILPAQIHPQSLYTNHFQLSLMSNELPYCIYKAFQALDNVIKAENRNSMFQFGPCVIYLVAFIARITYENKSWYAQRIPCDFFTYSNTQIQKTVRSYNETNSSHQITASQSSISESQTTQHLSTQLDKAMIPFAPAYTEVIRWVTNIGNLWRTNAPFNKRNPADSDICEGARGIYTTPGMKVDPTMFACVKKAHNMPEWDEKDKYFDAKGRSKMTKALRWSDVTKITTLQWNMDKDSITFFRWCITKVCLYMDTLVTTWEKPKAFSSKKSGAGSKSSKASKLSQISTTPSSLPHQLTPRGLSIISNTLIDNINTNSPPSLFSPQTPPSKSIKSTIGPSQSQNSSGPSQILLFTPSSKSHRGCKTSVNKNANFVIEITPQKNKGKGGTIFHTYFSPIKTKSNPVSLSPSTITNVDTINSTSSIIAEEQSAYQEVLCTPVKAKSSTSTTNISITQSSHQKIHSASPLKSKFATPLKSQWESPIQIVISPKLQMLAKGLTGLSRTHGPIFSQDPTTMSSIPTTPLRRATRAYTTKSYIDVIQDDEEDTDESRQPTQQQHQQHQQLQQHPQHQQQSQQEHNPFKIQNNDNLFIPINKLSTTRAILSPPDMKYTRMTRSQARQFGIIDSSSHQSKQSHQSQQSQQSEQSQQSQRSQRSRGKSTNPSQSQQTPPVQKISFELSDFPTAIVSQDCYESNNSTPLAQLTTPLPHSRLQPLVSQSAVSRLSVSQSAYSKNAKTSNSSVEILEATHSTTLTNQPQPITADIETSIVDFTITHDTTPTIQLPQSTTPTNASTSTKSIIQSQPFTTTINPLSKPYSHLTFPLVDSSFDYLRSRYASFTPSFLKTNTLTIPHESMIYCVTHIVLVASEFGSRPYLYGKQCTIREMEYLTSLLSSWLLFISINYPTSHALNRELVTEIVCCLYISKHNGIMLTPAVLRAMRFTVDLCLVDYYQRWAFPISGVGSASTLSTKIAESLRLGPANIRESTYIPIISYNQDKDSDACLFAQYHTHFLIALLYTLAVSDTFGGSGYNNHPTSTQTPAPASAPSSTSASTSAPSSTSAPTPTPASEDNTYCHFLTALKCDDDSILPDSTQWDWMYSCIDSQYEKYTSYQTKMSKKQPSSNISASFFEIENFWINQRNEHKFNVLTKLVPSVNRYTNLDSSIFDKGYKYVYQQSFTLRHPLTTTSSTDPPTTLASTSPSLESCAPSDLCGCPMCTYQIYVVPHDRIQECLTLCALVDDERYVNYQKTISSTQTADPASLLNTIPSVLHDINTAFVQIAPVTRSNFTPPNTFPSLLEDTQHTKNTQNDDQVILWEQQLTDVISRYALWTESTSTTTGQTRLVLTKGTKESTSALFEQLSNESDQENHIPSNISSKYTHQKKPTTNITTSTVVSKDLDNKQQQNIINFYQRNYYVQFYPELVSEIGFAQAHQSSTTKSKAKKQ